jgi:hypothetical protein
MDFVLQPWQFYFLVLSGWVHRQQQEVIAYLRTENQVLKEKLGKKRILLNDDQRRRLAVKGKVLGRKRLQEVGTLFTPDTILRWHRMLIAKKWDFSERRKSVGRPPVAQEVVDLVLRFARENPSWGYDRIQGALANVGHQISDQTVGNILKDHGIEPAPERKRQTTWATFLGVQQGVLLSSRICGVRFVDVDPALNQQLGDANAVLVDSAEQGVLLRFADVQFCAAADQVFRDLDLAFTRGFI